MAKKAYRAALVRRKPDGSLAAVTVNYGKAGLIALALVCVTVLAIFKVVPSETVSTVFSLAIGYVTGNGIGAVKADAAPSVPLIEEVPVHRRDNDPETEVTAE